MCRQSIVKKKVTYIYWCDTEFRTEHDVVFSVGARTFAERRRGFTRHLQLFVFALPFTRLLFDGFDEFGAWITHVVLSTCANAARSLYISNLNRELIVIVWRKQCLTGVFSQQQRDSWHVSHWRRTRSRRRQLYRHCSVASSVLWCVQRRAQSCAAWRWCHGATAVRAWPAWWMLNVGVLDDRGAWWREARRRRWQGRHWRRRHRCHSTALTPTHNRAVWFWRCRPMILATRIYNNHVLREMFLFSFVFLEMQKFLR